MFRNGVELDRNAWYIRLLHWMWGYEYYEFPNLCPLFWMVIGSICILPFFVINRVVKRFNKTETYHFTNDRNVLKSNVLTIGELVGNICLFIVSFLICFAITILFTIFTIAVIDSGGKLVLVLALTLLFFFLVCTYTLYVSTFVTDGYGEKLWVRIWVNVSWWNRLSLTPFYVVLWLCYPFYELFKWLFMPFRIFGYMVYAIYKKCCPIIKWK